MNPLPAFSASYAEARAKFLAAAAARGLAVETHEHPQHRGAQGEGLAIDAALLGKPDADALLLLTSGTHGVEGFCGSGVQVALLDDDDFSRAVESSGVAVLFVHALNPFGFSHVRRVNEDNVDLNRNVRDFAVPLDDAPYAEVHALMVPDAWPPAPENEARIAAYAAARGARALQAAVTSGQSAFPDGLFYAGDRPVWSNDVLRDVLRRHAARRRSLCWIDVHTGLGPYGHGEKIYAGPPDPATAARTTGIFGADVTSFHDGSSTSAALTGIVQTAAADECPRAEYAGIGLEFGTLPLQAVLQALRAEQWLHNHPDAPSHARTAIKRAMRDAFYPDSGDWKAMVFGQARAACVQALRGLGPSGSAAVAA